MPLSVSASVFRSSCHCAFAIVVVCPAHRGRCSIAGLTCQIPGQVTADGLPAKLPPYASIRATADCLDRRLWCRRLQHDPRQPPGCLVAPAGSTEPSAVCDVGTGGADGQHFGCDVAKHGRVADRLLVTVSIAGIALALVSVFELMQAGSNKRAEQVRREL